MILETLVLDQVMILQLILFFIPITLLLDIVLILYGEILSWSLVRVIGLKGFKYPWLFHTLGISIKSEKFMQSVIHYSLNETNSHLWVPWKELEGKVASWTLEYSL